ncbi:hypothetical protein CAEBREN_31638 [Caenorhabditis brenneri]|uniref:Hcy-binding domain-containing protein n=1 Tax=Caenorhabditis brenneri TaxID=135651 RepID=G0N7R1_CAEBE|nr:hypothetical protein CAEBREN_31638 [Caenorhabditis brenneri]
MKKYRLLDGSMSEQLKQFGYNCNDINNKPHWTFPANSDQSLMEKVYRSFLDIGVNNITTNTYHFGSILDKNLSGQEEKCKLYEKYFEDTCSLLCNLAQQYDDVQVWGSVGTFATKFHDCSEYNGKYMDNAGAEESAYEYYKTILTLFQERTTIRNLIFETIPSQLEGEVALKVLKEFKEMKAVISFTFMENACLRHGEHVADIAKKLKESEQIIGMGINCTDPKNVLPVLEAIKNCEFSDIFVYPNLGDAFFMVAEKGDFDDSDNYDHRLRSWIEHGATALGGCCGIDLDMIQDLRSCVDILNDILFADNNGKIESSQFEVLRESYSEHENTNTLLQIYS